MYGAGLAGKEPTIHVRGTGFTPIQIHFRCLREGFCLDPIHHSGRQGDLKIDPIGRLGPQCHVQRMEPIGQRPQQIFHVETTDHMRIVCPHTPNEILRARRRIIVYLGPSGCHSRVIHRYERQVLGDIIAFTALELFFQMISPENSAGAIR